VIVLRLLHPWTALSQTPPCGPHGAYFVRTSSSAGAVSLVVVAAAFAAVIAVALLLRCFAAALTAAAAALAVYRGMVVNYMKYKNNKYKNWAQVPVLGNN